MLPSALLAPEPITLAMSLLENRQNIAFSDNAICMHKAMLQHVNA